jgi:hypothetical protein
MLTDNVGHQEPGGTCFTRRDPERATRGAVTQLSQLGRTVTLSPIETAA